MGYLKNRMMELDGVDPQPYFGVYVCADCIDDHGLRAFIKDNASDKSCTFVKKHRVSVLAPHLLISWYILGSA